MTVRGCRLGAKTCFGIPRIQWDSPRPMCLYSPCAAVTFSLVTLAMLIGRGGPGLQVVEKLHGSSMSATEVHLLSEFFTARLSDWFALLN